MGGAGDGKEDGFGNIFSIKRCEPFIDFIGTVDEIDADKGKVKVLLSLFGRETPVKLDFLQVEKL